MIRSPQTIEWISGSAAFTLVAAEGKLYAPVVMGRSDVIFDGTAFVIVPPAPEPEPGQALRAPNL